jgi:CRP/FNR family transcriptional regulator, cyclic AMP receptor protein
MDAAKLKSVELFSSLSEDERKRVAQWADEIDVDTGHHLIREDGFGYEFFVILEGSAEVMRGDVHLADMTTGDFFGEIAMAGTTRRTASVRATTPMRLLVMGRPQFQSMSSLLPAVTERINARIAERIENSNLGG